MKTCTKCGTEKHEYEFRFRKRPARRNQCRECEREKRLKYNSTPEVKILLRRSRTKYRNTENGANKLRERNIRYRQSGMMKKAIEKYRKNNPEKIIANARVRTAIKCRHLVRPKSCSVCKTSCKPEAHHFDYSKPLEVVWVCKACHTEFHWGNCL